MATDRDISNQGVPIKLLHEAEGHNITLETENRTVFKGKLQQCEDNMNCQLSLPSFPPSPSSSLSY